MVMPLKPSTRLMQGGHTHSLTNGTDDASVAGHDGLRVDVQAAHVLQKGVSHGCVELLGLDASSPRFTLWLQHGS